MTAYIKEWSARLTAEKARRDAEALRRRRAQEEADDAAFNATFATVASLISLANDSAPTPTYDTPSYDPPSFDTSTPDFGGGGGFDGGGGGSDF